MEELLSLKWNNHSSAFINVLTILRDKQLYTDVTLACDGKFYSVHKLVLSTCSDYFSAILDKIVNFRNPVIVLKDIKCDDLESLLDYMYLGEVNVKQSDLASLIKSAECLRIKGLAVPDDGDVKKGKFHHELTQEHCEAASLPPPKRRRQTEDGRDDVRIEGDPSHSSASLSKENGSPNSHSSTTSSPNKSNNVNSSDLKVDYQAQSLVKLELTDPSDESLGNNDLPGEDIKGEPPDEGDLTSDAPDFLQPTSSGYSFDSYNDTSYSADTLGWTPDVQSSSSAAFAGNSYTSQDGSSSTSVILINKFSHAQLTAGKDREVQKHCKLCSRSFRDGYGLRRHMMIHNGHKPFTCPYCKYSSNQKGNLRVHMFNKHSVPLTSF